jgi:hypothetical protein
VLGHLHAWKTTPRVSKLVELEAGNARVECATQVSRTHELIQLMRGFRDPLNKPCHKPIKGVNGFKGRFEWDT